MAEATTGTNTNKVGARPANWGRKRKKTEGRKKRMMKLRDREAAKAHHEGKSKRSAERKTAFRKKKRGKK